MRRPRPAFRGDSHRTTGHYLSVTGYERLAVAGGETGAMTDDDHLLDPGRLKPREDGVEALLRRFRPAIVRYCRSRLARTRTRTRTGSLDEDDVAQEVCLALLSVLPSYRDMGRPFGAFVFAIAAQGGGRRARCRPARRCPSRSCPICPTGAWDRRRPC
jgi:RNA polymerase sigma-70 factor (ECF subfamily)